METKKECSNCHCVKSLNDFYFKKTEGRHNSWCKSCVYDFQKKRWTDRKIKAVELFGGKCSMCGYDKNYASLEFHHKDAGEKEFDWRKMRLRSWKSTIQELKKCIMVCKNCHGEIHSPDMSREATHDNNALNREIKATGCCPTCNEPVYGTKYCSIICANLSHRKVERPNREQLQEMLLENNFVQLGKLFGVSDNAVRKWAKYYGITK